MIKRQESFDSLARVWYWALMSLCGLKPVHTVVMAE